MDPIEVEAAEVVVSTVARSAKTRLFAVEGGEFDSREATISGLFFFYKFFECMQKTKKRASFISTSGC
jgi:hypothetical protein